MNPSDKAQQPDKRKEPEELRKANENIRKSQGDAASGPVDRKAGNKPAFDRDR